MARILLVLPMLCLELLGRAQNVDVRLLQQIHTPHFTQTDEAFRWVTNSTTFVSLGVPAGMLAMGWLKNDSTTLRNALIITASYAITGAISLSLKYAINRPRPFVAYPQLFQKKNRRRQSFFPIRTFQSGICHSYIVKFAISPMVHHSSLLSMGWDCGLFPDASWSTLPIRRIDRSPLRIG